MTSDKEERGVSSGYEKAECEAVPVTGQPPHGLDILLSRAGDWIMLTCGYALTGIIVLTSVPFLLG